MLFKPHSAFLGRPVRRPTGSPAHRPVEPPADRLTRRPERRLLLEVYDDATDTKGSLRGKNLQTQGKESANEGLLLQRLVLKVSDDATYTKGSLQ